MADVDTITSTLHRFEFYSYKVPTNCGHCSSLLMGLSKQGLHCQKCALDIHPSCQGDLTESCVELGPNEHNFRVKSFKTPTCCDYCSKLLMGFFNQGMKCTECQAVIHKACREQLDGDCQKIKNRLPQIRSGEVPHETSQLIPSH